MPSLLFEQEKNDTFLCDGVYEGSRFNLCLQLRTPQNDARHTQLVSSCFFAHCFVSLSLNAGHGALGDQDEPVRSFHAIRPLGPQFFGNSFFS